MYVYTYTYRGDARAKGSKAQHCEHTQNHSVIMALGGRFFREFEEDPFFRSVLNTAEVSGRESSVGEKRELALLDK